MLLPGLIEKHDLTTLLFKAAANNSSGQESSGFGNKTATIQYENTANIVCIEENAKKKKQKAFGSNIFAALVIFEIYINFSKYDK